MVTESHAQIPSHEAQTKHGPSVHAARTGSWTSHDLPPSSDRLYLGLLISNGNCG